MAFLTKDDFKNTIKNNVLDDVIGYDDTKIDSSSDEAVSLMEGYLNARYDTAAIFAASGGARHKTIVEKCKAIALYSLHAAINPRKIPKLREDNYDRAITWLEEVRDMLINPSGLPLVAGGVKDYVKYGSNSKRDNHY